MTRAFTVLMLLVVALVCAMAMATAGTLPPDPYPRANAQAVWANGKVHWFGGSAVDATDAAEHTFPWSCQPGYSIYNPATNSWQSSKWDGTGPKGIDNNGDGTVTIWEGTNPTGSQSFAYDSDSDGTEELFVQGGHPQWDGYSYRYDPDTDSWSTWGTFPGFSDGGYKAHYRGVSALYGNTVYCYGGMFWGPDGKSFAKYSFASDTWQELPDGPVAVISCTGGIINGKLYIAGGNQDGTDYSDKIWEYDIALGTWSAGPVALLSPGVNRPAVAVYNNKLYIVGGMNTGGDITDVQVFNPSGYTVTKIGDLPIGMSRGGAAIGPDGTLYTGGGYQNGALATSWWKAQVNSTPLSFTPIASDPAHFPFQDWVSGSRIYGQVTSGGAPIANAIVGVKRTAKATTDAQYYGQADSNGNYSIQVPDSTWCVAAWSTGWTPSADILVTASGGDARADLQLTQLAGLNIVADAPSTSYYVSSDSDYYPASGAVDDNFYTRWSTTSGGTEYFILELDPVNHSAVSLSGTTIYCDIAYPVEYRIDVMPTADPMWPMNWDDPAYYTTVYETAYGTGGYQQNVDHWVNPIRFDSPMMARGLRLYLTAPHTGFGNYSYWEIQVHSGTQYGTMVRGYVKDTADNPIYNAVVQLGGITGQTIITGPSGYFEFATTAGTHELYGDASGYGAKFTEVSPTAGSVVSQNLVLSAKSEVGAYNGSFEAAAGGDPTKADGWDVSYRFSPEIENMGGVDANGNPWPTPPADHYVGSRVTTENTTPSGSAGGWLKTNNPLPPPPPQVDYWGTILDVYWYWGILKPSADRRIPVTAGNQYNFYFKWKQEIAGFAFYEIQWQRADGSLIKRQRYYPWGNPPASWTQAPLTAWDEGMGEERPTIRMSPPADAAYIEPRVGLNHFHDQKIKDPTWVAGLFVDDLVVDEIVPPTVTGKVRDTGGNPVSGAIVGIKKSGKATADAMAYAETDVNGNYSIGATSGTHYLAAWKEGWTPSADTVINVTGDVGGVDLVLSSPAGANVAQGKPYKESTNWGEDIWDPAHGVDGDWTGYESRYATVGEGDQYYIIDLDPTSHLDVALSGITINWENRRCASYRIDAMPASAGVDPLDPANWTPANYSTVYSVTDTPTCGYHLPGLWPDNYVDPIRLTASARAIRVFMTKGLPQGMGTYVFFEVRAHSAALMVEKIGELKSLPLGTPVTLTGKMVTAAPAAGGVPSGVFYMEETDRSAGIRVSSVTAVAVGNSVVVSGALAETAGGELYIEASTVTPSDGTTPPPLAANTKTIADSLMNALLIKTAGTVRAVGADYFTIADGYYDAGAEVQTKVLTGGAPGVSVGEFVVVKGVASYDSGRVILKVP